MGSIDVAYRSILDARAEEERAKRAFEERQRRALARARSQVLGTTSEVVNQSGFRDSLSVQYCSRCPCITVVRNDGLGPATRILITMKGEDAFMVMEGGGEQVPVETNAAWLRRNVATRIAADIANRPLGIPTVYKYIAGGICLVLSIPFVIALAQAALQGAFMLMAFIVTIGFFASLTSK